MSQQKTVYMSQQKQARSKNVPAKTVYMSQQKTVYMSQQKTVYMDQQKTVYMSQVIYKHIYVPARTSNNPCEIRGASKTVEVHLRSKLSIIIRQ
jgi:hypothetical protein